MLTLTSSLANAMLIKSARFGRFREFDRFKQPIL